LLYEAAVLTVVQAVVKIDHRELAGIVEKALRGLGFTFLKNGGGSVFEFEVQSPCKCIVSVQNMTGPRSRIPFVAITRVESMVEVRRMIGGEQRGEVLSAAVRSIVGALSPAIPDSKWKGLDEFD
jgi:hypothetical protein